MASRDTPKTCCGGRWTEARKRGFVVSAIRRLTLRWPPRSDAKKAAKVGYGRYKCAACSQIVRDKDTHMDHKEPVVDPVHGFVGFDVLIERALVERDGWRLLCKACHAKITQEQREQRKLNGNNRKHH